MSTNVAMFLGVIIAAGITGAAVSYGVNEMLDDPQSQLITELEYTRPGVAYNCSYILPETLQINVYDHILDTNDIYMIFASNGLASTYANDNNSYMVTLLNQAPPTGGPDLGARLQIFWQMNAPSNGTLHYRIGPFVTGHPTSIFGSWRESTFAVTERFIDANERITLVIFMWVEEDGEEDFQMRFKIWDPSLEQFTTIESAGKQPGDYFGYPIAMRIDEMRFDPTSTVS